MDSEDLQKELASQLVKDVEEAAFAATIQSASEATLRTRIKEFVQTIRKG